MGHLREVGDCPLAFGDNTSRRCPWCGNPLPSGRRRWCSDACRDTFLENHYWRWARFARIRADGGRCVKCAKPGDGLFAVLEVNHLTPVLGGHDRPGCHHHQDLLESLCHGCHVEVTNQQRAAGLLRRPGS